MMNKITVPPQNNFKRDVGIVLFIAFLVLCAVFVKFDVIEVLMNLQRGGRLLARMFPLPEWTIPLLETLQMSVVGTFVGAFLALPIAILTARNIIDVPWVRIPMRFFLNILRTIPAMVLAALFVAVFGIGPFSGVLALVIFSFGLISKLTFESIEAIDYGQVEALLSMGAGRISVLKYAVVPQILPQFVSYTIYAFEVNVRAAAILGYVGAGGIGQLFEQALAWRRFNEVGELIIVSFIVVLGLDILSTRLRKELV